jgi:hypothetical protein
MSTVLRRRRIVIMALLSATILSGLFFSGTLKPYETTQPIQVGSSGSSPAQDSLGQLEIKGRAPKTGYARSQFGDGWATVSGCDTRNIILFRDLKDTIIDATCNVTKGSLDDPYTGKIISFIRGSGTSGDVQIDHVVALSNAWQTGAQQLTVVQRIKLANDPLDLLAVDGPANQQKSDGDAATWLPSNKPFRCQYVARQIAVKQKYSLWVSQAEHDVMNSILSLCPSQQLPVK